ncbi:MAG: methyltransferase domain-containing protein, partial [Pyrinomonadaceae bacterium]
RFVFLRAAAEALPFQSESFDVVICRLALPYTDNRRTLAEFARVLRSGGVLFLKTHHANFYLHKFKQGMGERDARSMVHAARVLAAGAIYHLSGRQPRLRIPSTETFQSAWLLRRELARCGLRIRREMPDSDSATPSFLIVKNGQLI